MGNDFITMYKGSDLNFVFYWPGNLDLTDYTLSVYDAYATIAGKMILAIEDAPTGFISGYMKWDETFSLKTPLTFRPRITHNADGATQTLPLFTVRVF